MGQQSGGNPRFKSAGTLWKSSWRGRVPFTEMCWFQGFSQEISGNWYQDLGGVLPLVPANGFFVGAVVGIATPPSGPSSEAVIASNGNVANEGWELVAFAGPPFPDGTPTVGFAFRVFDGAGIAAQSATPALAIFTDPQLGVDQIVYRVWAWFEPPSVGFTDGAIEILAETSLGGLAPLSAPYVNSDPRFFMGVGSGLRPFSLPNCIHGVVGGDGVPVGSQSNMRILGGRWQEQIGPYFNASGPEPEYQIVAPDGGILVPSLNPTDGWRANNPPVISNQGPEAAPNPMPPFIGSVDLDFAFPVGELRGPVSAACSRAVFYSETLPT